MTRLKRNTLITIFVLLMVMIQGWMNKQDENSDRDWTTSHEK